MSSWPWPGDSREDKARRIALSYREFAIGVLQGSFLDPLGSMRELDDRWGSLGQNWLFPSQQPLRYDDWLTAVDMGDLLCIAPNTIRMWGLRNHIRVSKLDGINRYNVGDVVSYEAKRRARRR